ncbi:hypothetical protein JCM1841_001088 [Sporobolomyces salmonicolor]
MHPICSPRFKPLTTLPSPPATSNPSSAPPLAQAQSSPSALTATGGAETGAEFRYEAPSPFQPTSASPSNHPAYPPRQTSLSPPRRPTYSRWAPEGYIPEPPTSPYKALIPKKALSCAGGVQAPAPSAPPIQVAAIKPLTGAGSTLPPPPFSPRSHSSAPPQPGSFLEDDARTRLAAAQNASSLHLDSASGAKTGASPSHVDNGLPGSQPSPMAFTAPQPAPKPQFDGITAFDSNSQVEKVASPSTSPSEVSLSHATLLTELFTELSFLRSALDHITASLSAHTAVSQGPDLRLQEAVREIVRLEDKLKERNAAIIEISSRWERVRKAQAEKGQVEEEMKEKERTWRERENCLLQEGAARRRTDAQSRHRVEDLEQTLAVLTARFEAQAREWAETERLLRLQIPAVPVRHFTPDQLLHLSTSPFISLYDPAQGTLPSEIDRRSATPSSTATRDLAKRFAELKVRYECQKNRLGVLSRRVATHDEERADLEEKNRELEGRLREAMKMLEDLGVSLDGERRGVPI